MELLVACPRVRAPVISWGVLRVSGERTRPGPPLAQPDPAHGIPR